MNSKEIFSIKSEEQFEQLALEVFRFQHKENKVYREFCDLLHVDSSAVQSIGKIPFLPIEFFKHHRIVSTKTITQKIFKSSGTTASQRSEHHITDLLIYQDSLTKGFQAHFGDPESWAILALLPSYLEQGDSSLVYMIESLINDSKHPKSGFYLNNLEELSETIRYLEEVKQPTLLIGVSYALLDLIDHNKFNLKYTTVMETGGMKGRRKEMIKPQLHKILCDGFGVEKITSEYGMTELLSQTYSLGNGIFNCPPWMRLLIRDPEDPMSWVQERTGGINVIDLANINSCSFIATQDLGRVHTDGSFEILGRFDNSDIRGCNLMVL